MASARSGMLLPFEFDINGHILATLSQLASMCNQSCVMDSLESLTNANVCRLRACVSRKLNPSVNLQRDIEHSYLIVRLRSRS